MNPRRIDLIDSTQIANLSIKQAAKLMGTSVSTVKRRMREGLPYVKEPGGWVRFSIADIVDWQRQYRHAREEESELMTPEKAIKIVRDLK